MARIMIEKFSFKKSNLISYFRISFIVLIPIALLCINISALGMGENRITITSMSENEPYNGIVQLTPISSDIIDEIMIIDHVQEVVSVVTKSYGLNFPEPPIGNFSDTLHPMDESISNDTPNWDDAFHGTPPDWNGTIPSRNFGERRNDMFDYVLEGIPLDILSTYMFYSIPDNVILGRLLQSNDSDFVYIGEDAQNYFNVSVGEQITIDGSSFTVIGIFSDINYSNYIYMNISDARNLLQLQGSELNTIYVYVDDIDSLDSVGTILEEEYPSFSIRYAGNPSLFKPQDQPYRLYNDLTGPENDLLTPGFEGVMLIIIIMGSIVYKRYFERSKSS